MALLGQTRDRALTRERWRQSGRRLVYGLASGRARFVILFLALLLTLWQLYFFVWRPLQEEALLPEGLTGVRARLDVEALRKVQEARAQRLQYQPAQFQGTSRYWLTSPVTTLTP